MFFNQLLAGHPRFHNQFAEFVKRSQTVYVIVWKLLFHHSIISISIANIHHFCEKRIVLTLFSEKAHIILYNKKALNSAD